MAGKICSGFDTELCAGLTWQIETYCDAWKSLVREEVFSVYGDLEPSKNAKDELLASDKVYTCKLCGNPWHHGEEGWTKSRNRHWYCPACSPVTQQQLHSIASGQRLVGFGGYGHLTYEQVLRLDNDWCQRLAIYVLHEPDADRRDPRLLPLAVFVLARMKGQVSASDEC